MFSTNPYSYPIGRPPVLLFLQMMLLLTINRLRYVFSEIGIIKKTIFFNCFNLSFLITIFQIHNQYTSFKCPRNIKSQTKVIEFFVLHDLKKTIVSVLHFYCSWVTSLTSWLPLYPILNDGYNEQVIKAM